MKTTVVALVLGVLAILAVVVTVITVTHSFDSNSTPIVTSMVGIGTSIVVSVMGLAKIEAASNVVKSTHEKLTNGLIPEKVTEALDAMGFIPPQSTSQTETAITTVNLPVTTLSDPAATPAVTPPQEGTSPNA